MKGLAHLLPEVARRYGDAPALITAKRTLSYRELDALSSRCAAALRARGLEPGERAAIYAENRWEWLVAYHGVLKAGLVVIPLNVMLTPSEVAFVVDDSEVAAIIGSADRIGPVAERAESLAPLRALISFDAAPAGCEAFDALLAEDHAALAAPEVDPRAVGSVAYTSGTTGHPKGAMQPARAALLNASLTATMHCRHAGDVMLTALPAAHVYGNAAIHSVLLTGGKVVLQERFEPGEMLELAERHKVTMIEAVPAMYAALLAHEDAARRDLSAITRCTVGGQTMPIETIRAWEELSGGPLIELWGMTEIAGLGTTHALHAPRVHGSIGVSLPGIEVKVADLEDPSRQAVPGEPGELMVRGPIVMLGYWGNEKATAETIEPDGWLHTGDIATVDEDGYFYVVDRHKDMILTAGYNVYPAEIERVVASHPAVSLVAVGKVPDEAKGELARAYIVLKPGAEASEEEILDHCREQLAAYKVPRSVAFVADLPKTSTGKILRRELASLDRVPEEAA